MSRKIVVKQNDLIENFIFNATESELQILNYAVAVTNPHWDNKGLVYRIDIPELVETYKTKSKNTYKLYREALLRLMDRKYFYYEDDIKQTENLVVRVSENIKDNSYLMFKFNDYISTRISELKGIFTKYDIKYIANFKSRYAFMMYEYFKMKLQQIDVPTKVYKKTFTVEEFKIKLDISDKYERFSNLENLVLTPTKNNINKHSDLKMSYKVKRKGRTPISITFTVNYKTKDELVTNTKAVTPPKEADKTSSIQNIKITAERQEASKKNIEILKKAMNMNLK